MAISQSTRAGTTTPYIDRKRYMFPALFLFNFSVPFLIMAAYWATGSNWWVLAIPVYFYVIIPIIDYILGEDKGNPPEEVIPALSADNYYRYILWGMVLSFFIVYIAGIWFIMTQGLDLWAQLVFAFSLGLVNGNVNTIGHELGHRTNNIDRVFARLAFVTNGNGHFIAEHNRHHHTHVSTPEDCSSSRYGESLYAFALRDIPGALKGAWALEVARLNKKGKPVYSLHNEILVNWLGSLVLALSLTAWLGWSAIIFIAIYKFVSFFILTLANYIEHYGLLRQKQENGRYEPCAPRHSWNTNHWFSNIATIHLQRHSDHHANPSRPYQSLRNFDDLPTLPTGYPG
ncbi:MAG: alkane 1-monooxygenase, partial [Aquisalinus sp.]|nr:alkane 1-monooxygenase [Aquisalinus sp.]